MEKEKLKIDKLEDITEIRKLDAAMDLMESAKQKLTGMFEGMGMILKTAKKSLLNLETEKAALQKIKAEQEEEISGLTGQQMDLLKEYEAVKVELEKFTRSAVSGDGDVSFEDMTATLGIYRVLLEEIWQSQPHFKVLLLLHGDAEVMDLDHLKNASGIAGAMVLRACHELAKANLITFDIETKQAKLVRRLFPKRNKKDE